VFEKQKELLIGNMIVVTFVVPRKSSHESMRLKVYKSNLLPVLTAEHLKQIRVSCIAWLRGIVLDLVCSLTQFPSPSLRGFFFSANSESIFSVVGIIMVIRPIYLLDHRPEIGVSTLGDIARVF
jgi:hypothetical protein